MRTVPPHQKKRERVLIVGVGLKGVPRAVAEAHLDELERLVDTAGGDVLGRFVKERAAPDPATYIGKGAVEEIGAAARAQRVALIVFDEEVRTKFFPWRETPGLTFYLCFSLCTLGL